MKLEDILPTRQWARDRFQDRIWAKVQVRGKDECWPWLGCCSAHGKAQLKYGRVGIKDRKVMTAHRVVYILTHGEIDDDLFACHTCDNPPCCNPAHLFAGTGKQNAQDRDEKGRYVLGGGKKLNLALARDIRALHKVGIKAATLAKRFQVSDSTIHYVLHNKTWKEG